MAARANALEARKNQASSVCFPRRYSLTAKRKKVVERKYRIMDVEVLGEAWQSPCHPKKVL
jgi:hypothetical protein